MEILKGNWISRENETLSISDTTSNDNHLASEENSRNLYLEVLDNTLSFQDRFYTSSDDYTKLKVIKYDMKIEEINDSLLVTVPTSKASKQFFNSSEPIRFLNQEYLQDSSFSFTKLIFHTSTCFGSCPVIHLEISSDKAIRFSGNYFKDENFNEIDSARSGNFTGQLSEELYNELNKLIIQSKITELEDGQNQILCCDGAIKTLILYHNDTRKYYKAMFEPRILRDLISFLYTINQTVDLTKVEEKFNFEK